MEPAIQREIRAISGNMVSPVLVYPSISSGIYQVHGETFSCAVVAGELSSTFACIALGRKLRRRAPKEKAVRTRSAAAVPAMYLLNFCVFLVFHGNAHPAGPGLAQSHVTVASFLRAFEWNFSDNRCL